MADECRIVVGCRVRPLNQQELELGSRSVWQCRGGERIALVPGEDGTAAAGSPSKKKVEHAYDFAFDQHHDNNHVYEKLGQPIIQGVLEGFNGTIFAYGQTSSGKTHTLLGVPEEMGIIVHSVHDIFDFVYRAPKEMEFLIRVSYMEIYNEEVKDLLGAKGSGAASLRLIEDPKRGCQVQGLKEVVVLSPDHVFELLKKGEEKRHYGATQMNYTSSRSHTLFRMTVESRVETTPVTATQETEVKHVDDEASAAGDDERPQAVQVSTLNLVDLAGSERVAKTEATGIRLKEGAAINKSLLVLGTVINKLADGHKGHIPFRDSKLTRLLHNSLGGNAKTAVVCTLSPATRNVEESKSTLKFASRAKTIVNKAKKNHVRDKSALIDQYRQEIADLKLKLASGSSVSDMPELSQMSQKLKEEESKRMDLEQKREKDQVELEEMRKLVLLTSKASANPLISNKLHDKVRSVANGEKTPAVVLKEVEDLVQDAENEENAEGQDDIVSSLPELLGRASRRPHRRRLSTLCQGVVASMAEQRKLEEQKQFENANKLWQAHLGEKANRATKAKQDLEKENEELRQRLQNFHKEQLEKNSHMVMRELYESTLAEVEGLRAEVSQAETKAKETLHQLQTSTAKVGELTQAVVTRNELIADLQGKIKETKDRERLEADLGRAEADKAQAEVMLASVREKYKAEIAELAETISKITKERNELEKLNLDTVQSQEKQLTALLDRLQAQQERSREHMAGQERQLASFKDKVETYEKQIQDLEEVSRCSALTFNTELSEARQALSGKEKTISQLTQELADAEASKQSSAESVAKLTEELEKLRADAEKTQKDAAAKVAQLKAIHKEELQEAVESAVAAAVAAVPLQEPKPPKMDEGELRSQIADQVDRCEKKMATQIEQQLQQVDSVFEQFAGIEERIALLDTHIQTSKACRDQDQAAAADHWAEMVRQLQLKLERLEKRNKDEVALGARVDQGHQPAIPFEQSKLQAQREASLVREIEVLKHKLAKFDVSELDFASGARVELDHLRARLNHSEAERRQALRDLEHATVRNDSLQSRVATLQSRLETMEQAKARVEEDLSERVKELHDASHDRACDERAVQAAMMDLEMVAEQQREHGEQLEGECRTLRRRLEELELEKQAAEAEAEQATQTFLSYQKSANGREEHLQRLASRRTSRSKTWRSASSLTRDISELQLRLLGRDDLSRTSRSPGTSVSSFVSSTATASHGSSVGSRGSATDGEILQLKRELDSAREELDVFRRLDVYSTSLSRGLGHFREKSRATKSRPDSGVTKAEEQRTRCARLLRIQSARQK